LSPRMGLVIDQERCLGCETCTVACRVENKPKAGRWIRVETVGGEHKDTPAGHYPDLRMDFLPRLCMHCTHPPCLEVCASEAIYKRDDGLVVLEGARCNSCMACLQACPYGAICYSSKADVVEKCNLCHHRIDDGLEPFCVICCEGQAMHFGDLDDPLSQVSRLIAARGAFNLMPEAGTSPSVYYCPPRERRKL